MTLARCLTLLLAALGVPAGSAWAASGWETAEHIRATAVDWVQAQSAAGVTAEARPLDSRLRLPRCEAPLSAASNSTPARGGWSVAVSCLAAVGSNPLWTVHVPVQVSELRTVVVLSRAVPPGQVLAAADLSLRKLDVSTLGYGYLEQLEQAQGQTLRRPFAAGSVLTPEALVSIKLVRRGGLVTLLSQSGGLQVRSQGKALQDGSSGERITVENTASHRVVQGLVRDGGTVEVGL